jgi:hypothetical protein
MTFDANAIFEQELSARSITFVKDGEDEYRLHLEGWEISVTLANVRRDAERDRDPDAIRRFVDTVLKLSPSTGEPAWHEASTLLLWSAEPADQDFGDSFHVAVSDEVARVLTLTDHEQTGVTWVTPRMCQTWGVTVEQASSAAFANQDRLLEGIELNLAESGGHTLGMVPLDSPYKASVIFADAFKSLVAPALGWPVLVVIPCRDFIYVVANDSPLVGRLGAVVVNEFRNSGYPITTEVLRISDEGIEAIGKFPT